MAGDPINVWVIGEFGVGKSALMSYVQSIVNSKFKDDLLGIFVYAPLAGITGIYDDAISDLRKTGALDRAISRVLYTVLGQHPGLLHAKKQDIAKVRAKLDDSIETYKTLVEEGTILPGEILENVVKGIRAKFPYVETKILKHILGYISEPEEAWDQLKRVRTTERLPALVTLVHFLHYGGYKMILLFIDQLEAGWRKWTKLQRDRFAIDVRELVVRTKPFLSVGMITNNDIISDININYPTLLRPLPLTEERTVTVRKFSFAEVIKLVEWYLSRSRINRDTGELAPFDEDAIRQIYEKRFRNTDKILVSCYDMLRHGATSSVKVISADVVKSWLKEGSLSDVPSKVGTKDSDVIT